MPSIVSCIKSCSFLTAIRIDDNIFLDLDLSILLVALRDLLVWLAALHLPWFADPACRWGLPGLPQLVLPRSGYLDLSTSSRVMTGFAGLSGHGAGYIKQQALDMGMLEVHSGCAWEQLPYQAQHSEGDVAMLGLHRVDNRQLGWVRASSAATLHPLTSGEFGAGLWRSSVDCLPTFLHSASPRRFSIRPLSPGMLNLSDYGHVRPLHPQECRSSAADGGRSPRG